MYTNTTVAALALLLSACAAAPTTDERGYAWSTYPALQAMPRSSWNYAYLPKHLIETRCGAGNVACTQRHRAAPEQCVMVLPIGADAYTVAHEEKHCEGLVHPDTRGTYR